MLEQPPERSPLEVEAEAAALAQASPQRRPHGCFRVLVWCMPTFLFYACFIGVTFLTYNFYRQGSQTLGGVVFLALAIGLTYGVGCFDAIFSQSTVVAQSDQRRKLILVHAARFTAWQILLVPAISFLLFGACMAVSQY